MRPIIRVEDLSKRYVIGARRPGYTTLRESLPATLSSIKTRLLRRKNGKASFWALQDVSFEVEKGEIVGILGPNGAGKSTLLKILSRVTKPTHGRVELYGPTSSLLEVGTGFHPELSGRENIFVNGAILGLKRSEITALFDEIVDFAEIEQFLETPVKQYSSGMYMRLAFAVAAHLNPEILIIDEVLSVGDSAFQKKCLGKVHDVANEGRTVLFVSHNLTAVENLCRRGLVLNKGTIAYSGDQTSAISHYLAISEEALRNDADDNARQRSGTGDLTITGIEFRDESGKTVKTAKSGCSLDLHFKFQRRRGYSNSNVTVGFMVRTALDSPVFLQHNRLTAQNWPALPETGTFVCTIKKLPLPPGSYKIGLSVMAGDQYLDRIDNAAKLDVAGGDFFGTGELPPLSHGVCLVEARWRLEADGTP
jgi:lipopolysaccharide transport system ATP-binding protein